MEENQFTEKHLLQSLISQSEINVFWKDKERKFLGANKSFLDYYGLSEEEILGKTDEDMGWHINPEPYQNDESRVLESGEPIYQSPGKCIIKGKVCHIIATKLPVRDDAGEVVGLIGYFQDVTDRKESMSHLIKKANTDELTGLLNRRGFLEAVEEYKAEYEKHGVDFAIIVLDVNNFKELNKAYGHSFGDAYLQMVAGDLLRIAGSAGVVARMGGDCFHILRQIPKYDTPVMVSKTILSIMDHIHLKQREVRMLEGHSFRMHVAAGWAPYSEFRDVKKMIKAADDRMYYDKHEE